MKSSSLCQDCGMMFETNAELANHKKKFCANSKYGGIDQLEKNFQEVSKNRDISKFGKMSLAMQGRTYDFQNNQQNTNKLQDQYRSLLKQIQDEKNMKNKLEAEKQKAFRQLQALQKQQQQLIIDDKRTNLQDIIARRQMLARQQQTLQKQIKQYQNKKKQWQKSQVKIKQTIDQPYQQGIKAGKLTFERAMLEQRKHNMQLQLNAKRRQKQKIQNKILQMSDVQQIKKNKSKVQNSRIQQLKQKLAQSHHNLADLANTKQKEPSNYIPAGQFNSSKMNINMNRNYQDRPKTQASFSSQISKTSSYLGPSILNGTQKILKFNLNKQGKSQQDKLIQTIMAQQYDDLMILSKLPKGSDLYNMKLKQYQQLSKQRMQVQQKAQKQRIQKMKKQFEYQKIINQKQKQNMQWVDTNRKQFIKKQMQILKGQQLPNDGRQSKNSIVLNPSTPQINQKPNGRNIPTGMQNLPNGIRNPSLIPGQPQLGSANSLSSQMKSYPYQNNNPNINKKQQKNPFGYRISILALKNYSLKKAIKIKLILYQQYYHEAQKGIKYQYGTIYHDQSINAQDPFNPHFKNKLDQQTGSIAYNESFYIPQNLQQIYNKNQKQIYLLILAAQKDQKKISNQPKAYAWYSFKVTHFGQIKQGRFTVNLYGDDIIYPYPADMNKMKKKKQQEIVFQLQQVLLDQHMLQYSKNKQNTQQNMNINNNNNNNNSNSNNNNKSNIPNDSDRTGKASIQNNLHKNSKQFTKPISSSGLIKQTGSQMIPASNNKINSNNNNNNNNSDKMQMNYPIKLKNIQQQQTIQINSQYFYSNEKPTQFSYCQLKKPLNIDISISGLRTLPSYIGPIKLQISFIDSDNSDILPRQQFLAQIGTDLYNPLVNYTRKIRNQSRIPPSTIIFIRMIAISALDYQVYSLGFTLLYLFLNKQGQTIKTNKINNYLMTSGYYQLPIFWGNIQPQYIDIQQLLINYPPIPCCSLLIGILQNASNISNQMPLYNTKKYNTILFQIDDNQGKLFEQQYKRQPLDTNTLISGYLQYKGIKKNYSGEQINKYLYKTLLFSSQNINNKLQLKWMAEYQQYFGMNFIIDKLYIPQQQLMYYYFITICISPPAQYYKKKSFDLNFCRKLNFQNSTSEEFYYIDNQFFINPAYYKNSSIIIEINRIQIFQSENTQADNNIEGFAYVVIPLFQLQQDIRAVNVMKQNVPLILGDFDANNIQKLEKNLSSYMEKMNKNKKSKAYISVRLLNGYFMNQFLPPKSQIGSKTKMLKDIVPENMDFDTALEQCGNIIGNNYNLQINDY